jgi:hypothetical protein
MVEAPGQKEENAMTPFDPEFIEMRLERLRQDAQVARSVKAARTGKPGLPARLIISAARLMIYTGGRLVKRYQANSSQTQAHKSFTLDLG